MRGVRPSRVDHRPRAPSAKNSFRRRTAAESTPLRNPATARDTGRTNKTPTGTRRRTIHTSVLESLRCYLREFTLSSVITEVQNWLDTGQSCFARMLKKLGLSTQEHSVLEALYPKPDG